MKGRIIPASMISALLCFGAGLARAGDNGGEERDQWRQGPLDHLAVEVEGEARSLAGIELVGLDTVREEELWRSIGCPKKPLTFGVAADLMRALDATQAFARIEPRLRVAQSTGAVLEIHLVEHPQVRRIVVHGLTEVRDEQIVADLLGCTATATPDQPPEPQPAWLAQLDAGTLRAGILCGGVEGAVRRAMRGLFDAGYRMADASGMLSPDGTLTIEVDEGRIAEIRLVGTAGGATRAAEEALDLPTGRTFLDVDVSEALKRVERELPFLQADRASRATRALPFVATSLEPAGGIRFSLSEAPAVEAPAEFAVAGHTLTLFFKARVKVRFASPPDELLRHTPVGGIGIGIRTDTKVWDPKNRVHLRLETFSGTLDQDARAAVGVKDGGEYAVALRARMPALRIADLSLESHGAIDTADGWRMSRYSSYMNSLFFNRPDSEYYWRVGSAVSLTLQPARELLLGIEHRSDTYHSMPALAKSPAIFNTDEPFDNPAIDEGHVESTLFRAELFSEPVPPEQIRGLFRSPETSIVARPRTWGLRSGYQMLATLEVARPRSGSDDHFSFTRLVSDNMLFLATGAENGLRLRARVAGGSGLPLQKQEALGGWSALRGFEFKEFRGGDWSALGMIEYRQAWISGFVDIGSLHRPAEGWNGAHVGAGVKVHIDSLPLLGRWLKNKRMVPPVELVMAWRLDGRGVAQPEMRLLVGHLF
jgi:hypothetical protein